MNILSALTSTELLTATASNHSTQWHNMKLKMITTEVNYKGKTYTCRVVKSNEDEELIIAGTSLLAILMPYSIAEESDVFADNEAETVDEEIFFYTADQNLKLSDYKLVETLKEDNPEWFN